MEMNWKLFEKEKPAYGQMVIIASEESSIDGFRDYDIAVYKQFEFFYASDNEHDPRKLCEENPHFEGVDGGWIDDPEFWMPIPKIDE